ncbi:hypothetical protein [Synechococcus sp. PCC 6312]|uniref:hypothetical protein n=1 Tax=Synechococcus sp. (strain ATCC 27167 / PCC 6312) TaxID=195253 RepID=UPI00029F1BD2|nr:hypothetical protein [Synechococcus sp. PCC 6312]AFY60075.1 hypothetical protein Syn6312_0867 [Synechococcus sp. PCC 6312]
MSEPITASEAKEILDTLKSMQSDIQTLTIEIKVTQAQLKSLDDKVDELRDRQRDTDKRLWSFIVALILLLTGGLVKLTLFDKV